MLALCLAVLLGFGAVILDVGYGRCVQQQLQMAADAGAHAGTLQLNATTAGVTAAHRMAAAVAGQNNAAGSSVVLDANLANDPSGDVVTGVWDDTRGTFTPSTSATEVNAVRVRPRLASLNLLFSPLSAAIHGASEIPVSAETYMTAAPGGGAGAMSCYLPLAIPSCLIGYHGGVAALESVTLRLAPSGIDSVGWGRARTNPISASWSRAQIRSCQNSGEAAVGDPVYLQNGVVSSALTELTSAISGSATSWSTSKWGTMPTRGTSGSSASNIPASKWGHTLEGPILVFDGGPGYCQGSGGSFNQHEPLAGFMWGAVYDVTGTGANSSIRMRLDPMTTRTEDVTRAGGGDWGMEAPAAAPHAVAP
jgi:Flp pilus assembly protein TadG